MEKLINVQIDAASIVELERCLHAEYWDCRPSLAVFAQYCGKVLGYFLTFMAADTKLHNLLAAEDLPSGVDLWQDWRVSLLLCSDSRMAHWNLQFRGQNKPTDILSFPAEQGGGDLLLSLCSWRANCREFSCSPAEELQRLLLHGLLHLTGLEHHDAEELQKPNSRMLLYQETLLEQNAPGVQL